MIRVLPAIGIVGAMLFAPVFSGWAYAKKIGEWSVHGGETDPITDTKNITAFLRDPTDDNEVIVLQCHHGELSAFIMWDFLGNEYRPEVIVRFDALEPRTETWPISRHNDAIFAPDTVEFMTEMMEHERLAVRIQGRKGTLTGVFYLENTPEVVAIVGRACNIPETTWSN